MKLSQFDFDPNLYKITKGSPSLTWSTIAFTLIKTALWSQIQNVFKYIMYFFLILKFSLNDILLKIYLHLLSRWSLFQQSKFKKIYHHTLKRSKITDCSFGVFKATIYLQNIQHDFFLPRDPIISFGVMVLTIQNLNNILILEFELLL